MRVAIFEPDPRVCGPLSWAGHLKTGFAALGVECDTVSANKSGKLAAHWGNVKPGGHWWSAAPDRISKIMYLPTLLREYDFVLLPEPKSPLADKQSVKDPTLGLPWYIAALRDSGVRFSTALHGNPYTDSNAPFAQQILELPNFTGTLVAHTAPLRTVTPAIAAAKSVELPLPYAAKVPIDAPFPRAKIAGTTGRFMFNKGSHVTGLAGQYLDPDTVVEIWGSCSTGRGPSLTYNLYEELKPLSSAAKRYHNSDPTHPKATEDGNIVQPFKYDVRLKDAALVRYLGNYTDPIATAQRLTVHVNLTSGKYTSGMEFSTLEALDAGCLAITPPHCSDAAYRTLIIKDWFAPAGSVTSALKKPEETMRVADTIKQAFGFLDQPESSHRDLVEQNRVALRTSADPAQIAYRILEECR